MNVAAFEPLTDKSSAARDATAMPARLSTGQDRERALIDSSGGESSRRATLAWILLALSLACRAVALFLLKSDAAYVLVPRSFVGGGFQSTPALLDLAVPILMICALWRGRGPYAGTKSGVARTIADALFLLLFSLAAGFSLFAYESGWGLASNLTLAGVLRWLQFVAAYVAWNALLDEIHGKWQRLVAVPALVLSLGVLQDAFLGMFSPILLLISVGWTLTWTVLALRRHYRQSPLAATLGAAAVGAISCLLVVKGPSESWIPFLLLFLALPIGAITLHSSRWWARWAALAGITAIGLVFSLVVPRVVSPSTRDALLSKEPPVTREEQIEGITVRYNDVRVRPIAVRMAHVIAAANQVSQEVYGVSPQANELIIPGIEMGGFRAVFPNKIYGNLVSTRQIDLLLNASFLNDPAASVDLPDPVNAILHEYSHLYGIVPYQPWLMGTEGEGWATFAATRLSRRLYERFGPGLWSPPYNYAARAEAITNMNLGGRAVYWSHPQEYAGFRLWYQLSQRDGEVRVFRKRWDVADRKLEWSLQRSDPAAARRVADAFGRADFVSFGSATPVRYGQIYKLQDVVSADEALGLNADEARARYQRRADKIVDANIQVPARTRVLLDTLLSTCLLILGIPLGFLWGRASRT